MFKHYLIITLRGIYKDKAFSLINIVGLAIAIACAFLLIFWIKFETSFENRYTYKDRIYKLLVEEERSDGLYYSDRLPYAGRQRDFSRSLKKMYPQIEAAASFVNQGASLTTDMEDSEGIMVNMANTSSDFLRMFSFEYVEGSPHLLSTDKGRTMVITEETATLFFGKESAVSKTLYLNDWGYTIEAVIKLPPNTNLQFDVLVLEKEVRDAGMHFIMLKEKERMTESLSKQLAGFLSTQLETKSKIVAQKLTDVHLHTPAEIATKESYGIRIKYGNYAQIIYFSVAVLLILIMAIINYVNTSIARAMNRMKEVGVRKVTGAHKKQLIERFLFESFIITAIAVVLSFAFTQFFFPEFSEIMGNKISFIFDKTSVLIALLVCLVISALSGGYAAFYLSGFKPAIILKGGVTGGSKERLRGVLLGVQFFLSIGILISTVIIYKQINALFNESSGMDRSNIIVLDTNLWYESEDFITIIKQENPNIIDATMSNCPPYNAPWGYSGVTWEGAKGSNEEIGFTQIFCDSHYASTFGLEIIQGEFIPPGLGWWQDTAEDSHNIVVNESFVRLMGVDNPIGVSVKYAYATGKIIGVVKDFNFKPLKEKTAPLFMTFNPESQGKLYIKTTGKDKQATLEYIVNKYKEMKPMTRRRPVLHYTVEDEYNRMYEDEIRTANILSTFSIISLFLALMGVTSMVSFMIEKRTKEIAIRKINGAKTLDIILLFWKDIVAIAAIASVLVIPVCYIFMQRWLEGYIYRTALSWWIFLGIPVLIIGITCLIVAIQVIFTARQRPIESLRSE